MPFVVVMLAVIRFIAEDSRRSGQTRFHVTELGAITGWALVRRAEDHAARGDEGLARMLFTALHYSPSRRIADHATLWLQADAARRAEWREVQALGIRPWTGHSPKAFSAFLGRIRGVPWSDVTLVLRWLWASHRVALWPWLTRAHLTRPVHPPELGGGTLERAMSLHAWAMGAPRGTVALHDLVRLGALWDEVADDPGLLPRLGLRIAAVGARITPEDLRDDLLQRAEEGLAALVDAWADVDPFPPCVGLLDTARRRVWDRRAEELERLCIGILSTERLDSSDPEPHWSRWGQVRHAWQAARDLSTPDERAMLYASCWGPTCNWAVDLVNRLDGRTLGNHVFTFLMHEGKAVGATGEARTLPAQNVAATG